VIRTAFYVGRVTVGLAWILTVEMLKDEGVDLEFAIGQALGQAFRLAKRMRP
jgi:hypothetical protein